jgi:hypothetical protein
VALVCAAGAVLAAPADPVRLAAEVNPPSSSWLADLGSNGGGSGPGQPGPHSTRQDASNQAASCSPHPVARRPGISAAPDLSNSAGPKSAEKSASSTSAARAPDAPSGLLGNLVGWANHLLKGLIGGGAGSADSALGSHPGKKSPVAEASSADPALNTQLSKKSLAAGGKSAKATPPSVDTAIRAVNTAASKVVGSIIKP